MDSILFCFLMFQVPVDFRFTDVTESTGVSVTHGYADSSPSEPRKFTGGAAAGDVDGDGWVDLFLTGGETGGNRLFRNLGNGHFEDVTAAAGLVLPSLKGSGPTFADLDGDGDPDLLIGGIEGTGPVLLRNDGGSFTDVTATSGLMAKRDTISAAFADIDGDGDLDAFLTHWTMNAVPDGAHLWRNDGDLRFTCIDAEAGIDQVLAVEDFTFTPNFADIDNDGDPDLLLAADFGTSMILQNENGIFRLMRDQPLTDENGMGGAVGDYDNDGDLDWFVTSIWDPDPDSDRGWTGNRLYRNDGSGQFSEVTGVMTRGYWGWGASFADFNLDGNLDLVHVNGWFGPLADSFVDDPSRLFLGNGDGGFFERSEQTGFEDRGQGRGLVCFDYDRDGDLDLYVANAFGPGKLYRNDRQTEGRWLAIRLRGSAPNTEAVGARITLLSNGIEQTRELRAGSNYVSQNPVAAHFGVPGTVDRLTVRWPDGETQTFEGLEHNRELTLHRDPLSRVYLPLDPAFTMEESYLTIISQTEGMVTVTGYAAEGGLQRITSRRMPAGSLLRRSASELFARHSVFLVMIEAEGPLFAYAHQQGPNGAVAVPATSKLSERLIVPHIAADTDQFITRVQLVNAGEQDVASSLSTPDGGHWPNHLVSPKSGVSLDMETFFGDVNAGRTWAGVSTEKSQKALAGTETFADRLGERHAGLGLVGGLSQRLLFSHIGDARNGWWTGIAIVNPQAEASSVTLTAFREDGTVSTSSVRDIGPGEKWLGLVDAANLGEALFAEGLPRNAAWLSVESARPITGYELFGRADGRVMAGFQAGTDYVDEIFFPYIGDTEQFAAIAVVGEAQQSVRFALIDPSGREVAAVTREIVSGERLIALASELFEETPANGYIRVRGSAGLHGFMLYGDHKGSWLVGLNGLTWR